jgi:hypothetical protein
MACGATVMLGKINLSSSQLEERSAHISQSFKALGCKVAFLAVIRVLCRVRLQVLFSW